MQFSPDFSVYSQHIGNDGRKYIPGLDGLRAISVLLVIFAHAGLGDIVPGGLGVSVFFFISGFIITNILINEILLSGNLSLANFYLRRFIRLAPEMYLYIAVSMLVAILMHSFSPGMFLVSATYTANYAKAFHYFEDQPMFALGHYWSLAVEEHFYLIFPAFLLFMRKNIRHAILLLCAWCIISVPLRWFLWQNNAYLGQTAGASIYTYYATECRIDGILYGCIFAISTRLKAPRISSPLAVAILTASVAIMLVSLLVRDVDFRSTWRYSFQGVSMLIAAYVLYFSSVGAYIIRLLELTWLTVLGRLSYGMYLWHFAPTLYAQHMLGDYASIGWVSVIVGAATVAVSAGAAFVSREIALKPFDVLRRRFGSHGTPPLTGSS